MSTEDTIVTATDHENIVGVVRLSYEEGGVIVLRGMEVSPEYQRKGIGTQMLAELDKIIGKRECWGIPLSHLESFYGKIGFRFVDVENALPHLVSRMAGYHAHNLATKNQKENRIMLRLYKA